MAVAVDTPYRLIINTAAGERTYPVLRDGFSLVLTAGADGKHATSSCSISTRGAEVLFYIMYATELLEARLEDDAGTTVFTGVIRPYASITASQQYLGNLQLEILDYTEKLHKKVFTAVDSESDEEEGVIYEKNWDGYSVCNPSDTEHSIVHQICELGGITIAEAPSINVTLHRFTLEEGKYLDDILSTLLYEYVYDYRFDEEGKMHIFQSGLILEPSTDSEGSESNVEHDLPNTKTVSVFRNSLTINRAEATDETKSGAIVRYDKFKSLKNICLYTDELWGISPFVDVQTGWQSATNKEIIWDLSQINNDSGKEIMLSNFWVEGKNTSVWLAGTWGTVTLGECDDTKGHISYDIGAAGGLGGRVSFTIKVYADVTYLKAESKSVGFAGDNAEEYTAQYIESLSYALSLANAIRNRASFGSFSYSFESTEKILPGTVITLQELDVAKVETVVRITKRTQSDEYGLYKYEAEGYGKTSFSKVSIDKDSDVDAPQTEPDFFLMQVSDDNVLPEEEDNTPLKAEAWGSIFSKYGAKPVWYLNGVIMNGFTELIIQFSKSMLANGANKLRCEAEYDGETYFVEKTIKYISLDIDVQMQFAALPSGSSPDSSTVWQDAQPAPTEGQVIWMRFRTSSSGEWIVMKMTAEDGGNPVVFFQWAATSTIAPDEGVDILTWGDMAITWEIDGEVMAFVLDSGRWETLVPDKPFGLNYLWVKYWNYQEDRWDYFCTTGSPAMDFNLIVNPQTYKLTSRNVTKESTENNDKCQRINIRCQKLNTTAPVSWDVTADVPEPDKCFSWVRVNEADDSEIVIIINPMVALPAITVHCSIADINTSKDFVISGIQEGKAETMYMGVIMWNEPFPEKTTEGPLAIGDCVLVEESDGRRSPFYWNGTEWVLSDGNTPVNVAWKIAEETLFDALQAPGTIDSQSVTNQHVANLAVYKAFIFYLKVRSLFVGDGSDFSFEVFDYQNGEKVSPVVRCLYKEKSVFQINPATGNVFFGQVNNIDNPTAIIRGFMYDASSGEIRGPSRSRFYIDQNGYLHATGVDISGKITATSGEMKDITISGDSVFYGILEASSITTQPGDKNNSNVFSGAVSDASFLEDLDAALGAVAGQYYPVTVSGYSSIAFLLIDEFEKSGSFSSGACTFCDSNRNPIQLQSVGIKLKEYSGSSYNPTTVSSGKFSIDYNTHSWGGVFPRPSVSLSSPTSITITVYPSSILKLAIPLSEDGSDLLPFQVYRTSNGTLKINA